MVFFCASDKTSDAATLNSISTLVSTLLTFCPPLPPERDVWKVTSFLSICISWDSVNIIALITLLKLQILSHALFYFRINLNRYCVQKFLMFFLLLAQASPSQSFRACRQRFDSYLNFRG